MPTKNKKSGKQLARHLHRRILFQLCIFVIIALVMFGIVVFDAAVHHLNLLWILLGALAGIVLGFIVSRSFQLHWHEDSQKVIMSVDKTGFLIIVAYVLIRSLMNSEAKELFNGIELIAVTYSVLGGIMIGRVISMWRRILRLLGEQKII